MFLFNKGHGHPRPGSRQSFFDSYVPDSSTAQHWERNPPLDASGEDQPLPPPSSSGQERGISGKRTSLLPMRSRSDTTTSVASHASHTSVMAGSEGPSRRVSQDMRSQNHIQLGRADNFDVKPKASLFSRGKILKRSSRIVAETNVNGEHHEMGKRLSVLRRDGFKKTSGPQESSVLRHRISSPFDFQHLTHTAREHLNALDGSSQTDLAAEFMAVRHSQMPRRELTGIKADDLSARQGASQSASEFHNSPLEGSQLNLSPPRLSPQRSYDRVYDNSPSPTPSRKGSLKQSRSVESFSQPKIKSSPRASMGITPPPRVSSRTALARIDDEDGPSSVDGAQPPAYISSPPPGFWQSPLLLQRQFGATSPTAFIAEEDCFAHAVTTIGDAAIPSLSPAFALENVPEEPESYFNPRPAPQPPVRQSPLFEDRKSPESRHVSGSPQPMNRLSTQSTIKALPISDPSGRSESRASTTLAPAFTPRPRLGSPPKVASLRRQSILQEFDACWEDDIDYCYDHAAEADCEYDWDRNSFEIDESCRGDVENDSSCHTSSEPASSVHGLGLIAEEEEDETMRTHFLGGNFRPSLLVPETETLPELGQRSSLSPSTTEPSLCTPSDASQQTPALLTPAMPPYYDPNGFEFHPPLLLPQDSKFQTIRDDMYDELLAEYQSSEKHYPILDGSSLSSATRLSKRSSYDSSIRSGSGSLYSTMRRSASSAGSLPDLVHSRRSTKRAVEVLADQMTFAVLDGDDADERDASSSPEDESTPTNVTEAEDSTSSERTFFAAEDDETPSEPPPSRYEEKEDIVREPIRRPPTPVGSAKLSGSVVELELDSLPPLPVSPAPAAAHHERAASESTAKLLSYGASAGGVSPQPGRQRSASHSKPRGAIRRTSGYTLSLFPPPPKERASPIIPSFPTPS